VADSGFFRHLVPVDLEVGAVLDAAEQKFDAAGVEGVA